MNLSIIGSSYDIRGIYPTDLDEDFYYRFGRALVSIFHFKRAVIGQDARLSSPSLAASLVRGITDGGVDVVDIGICSTDMVSFSTGHYAEVDFGIMVTASHNPKEYNGMKISSKYAVPVNTKTYGAEIREAMMGDMTPVSHIGSTEERDIVEDWIEHICSFIDVANIQPLKVVADAGNGTAGVFFGQLAKRVGIECVPMYFDPDGNFPNHHPSPIEPENMVDLINMVKETHADLGVAFDGDADRMYVCDETGIVFSGTVTTAAIASILLARHPRGAVVYNAVCGDTVRETILAHGGTPIMEKVGHVYLKEAMAKNSDICFGGEHSGHYYFRKNWNADSGVIAFMILLESICLTSKKPSELRKEYEPNSVCPTQKTHYRAHVSGKR